MRPKSKTAYAIVKTVRPIINVGDIYDNQRDVVLLDDEMWCTVEIRPLSTLNNSKKKYNGN